MKLLCFGYDSVWSWNANVSNLSLMIQRKPQNWFVMAVFLFLQFDIFDKQSVFIPIHHQASFHWTCGVINFRQQKIEHYDSSGWKDERGWIFEVWHHLNYKTSGWFDLNFAISFLCSVFVITSNPNLNQNKNHWRSMGGRTTMQRRW